MIDQDNYAFKVWNPETGREYKIYADGRVKGFEHESAVVIVNRIPRDYFLITAPKATE